MFSFGANLYSRLQQLIKWLILEKYLSEHLTVFKIKPTNLCYNSIVLNHTF